MNEALLETVLIELPSGPGLWMGDKDVDREGGKEGRC